jgi:hypothetical protein
MRMVAVPVRLFQTLNILVCQYGLRVLPVSEIQAGGAAEDDLPSGLDMSRFQHYSGFVLSAVRDRCVTYLEGDLSIQKRLRDTDSLFFVSSVLSPCQASSR